METVTLSSKYQLVIPRGARDRMSLKPGAKLTVIDKGGVLFLVPSRSMKDFRGVAKGARPAGLRDKKDRN